MANVKAAMEYAQTFEREAMEKILSESDLEAPTLIHVVAKHEQEIQELKRLITPMMEFKQEQPTTMGMEYAANFEKAEKLLEKKECYDSPGPSYKHVQYPPDPPKEWVGLTEAEVNRIFTQNVGYRDMMKEVEILLKEKNGGDSAIDTELQRLGYPL